MKIDEAIEILNQFKEESQKHKDNYTPIGTSNLSPVLKIMQDTYQENIDALDMAIEALEKQTGLEPIDAWDDGMVCQFCGGFVTCQRWRNGKPYCEELKYCPNCGHKVNWQEV